MKRSFAVVIFLLAAIANAKDKPQVDYDYQDAVLVSFQTIHSGSICSTSGTIKGEADSSGNVTGSTAATSGCADTTDRHYTIKFGDHTYVLKPASTKKSFATLGLSDVFGKGGVLSTLLPGTHIQIRTDVKGFAKGFYVKVDKRESKYVVVGAE